jgi:hypothetical protein
MRHVPFFDFYCSKSQIVLKQKSVMMSQTLLEREENDHKWRAHVFTLVDQSWSKSGGLEVQ